MSAPLGEPLAREAPQRADLCRLSLGLLAERLVRADLGARAAEDVSRKDRLRRGLLRAAGDLADEAQDVDRGPTSRPAGDVVAEGAPLGRYLRLLSVERGEVVVEIGTWLGGTELADTTPGAGGELRIPTPRGPGKDDGRSISYQTMILLACR